MKNFIIRAITGLFFVAAIVVCFLRPVAMMFLFALITGLTLWELGGLVNGIKGVSINRFITTVAGTYLFLATAAYCNGMAATPAVYVPYLFAIIYLIISELYMKAENPVNNWAYTMFTQMYVALPLSTINVLAFSNGLQGEPVYNYLVPLSVFVCLWANDTGAYCCGSLFGKHKMFPRISPAKTWEGTCGGALVAMVIAGFIGYYSFDGNGDMMAAVARWAGLGLVVVVAGTLGDLVESLFKRTIGIKDSGSILPGHGGMLDRFDSSLMALPAVVVYLFVITLL